MSAVAARGRPPGPRPFLRSRGAPHEAEVTTRLRRVAGQMSGVLHMYESGRYCIDVLDQLAAARAAIDGVALLILEDHVATCVARAVEKGEVSSVVPELTAAFRRYVRAT